MSVCTACTVCKFALYLVTYALSVCGTVCAPRRPPAPRAPHSLRRAVCGCDLCKVYPAPRPGARGSTIAFMHPKGSFGTLIELVQE